MCAASPVQLSAQEKQGIVVWQLEAKTGVSQADVDSLSGYVTSEVEKYSGLSVISQADIRTVLQAEETKQKCGEEGDTDSCLTEICNALGVPEAVSGDLGRVGDLWILYLRRVDMNSVKVIKRSSRKTSGDITALVNALPGAVAELFGKKADEPPPQKQGMSEMEIGAYSTFFPGAAFVVFGVVGSFQVKQAKEDYDESAHSTWSALSIAGYAVGGAAMLTGALLWILDAQGVGAKDQAFPSAHCRTKTALPCR